MRRTDAGTVRSKRGVVAVILLAVLAVTGIMVVVLLRSVRHDGLLTVDRVSTLRAFYAAEGGMNMAVRELMVASDEDGDGGIGTISNDGDAGTDPAVGFATVHVESAPAGPDTLLISHGNAGDAHRQVEALTR